MSLPQVAVLSLTLDGDTKRSRARDAGEDFFLTCMCFSALVSTIAGRQSEDSERGERKYLRIPSLVPDLWALVLASTKILGFVPERKVLQTCSPLKFIERSVTECYKTQTVSYIEVPALAQGAYEQVEDQTSSKSEHRSPDPVSYPAGPSCIRLKLLPQRGRRRRGTPKPSHPYPGVPRMWPAPVSWASHQSLAHTAV